MVTLSRVALTLGMLAVAPAGMAKPLLTVTCFDSEGRHDTLEVQERARKRLSGKLEEAVNSGSATFESCERCSDLDALKEWLLTGATGYPGKDLKAAAEIARRWEMWEFLDHCEKEAGEEGKGRILKLGASPRPKVGDIVALEMYRGWRRFKVVNLAYTFGSSQQIKCFVSTREITDSGKQEQYPIFKYDAVNLSLELADQSAFF